MIERVLGEPTEDRWFAVSKGNRWLEWMMHCSGRNLLNGREVSGRAISGESML